MEMWTHSVCERTFFIQYTILYAPSQPQRTVGDFWSES
jgi:hypothetical protein